MLQQDMTLARWLFNPFLRIAGWTSLVAGLAAITVSGLVAAAAGMRLDGLLEMGFAGTVPAHLPVLEGLIHWISIAAICALIARVFGGGRSVRLLDVAGTLALARAPQVIAALACTHPLIRDSLVGTVYVSDEAGSVVEILAVPAPSPVAWAIVVVALACMAWMVVLMWRAFSVTSNIRGWRGVAFFIPAYVGAELLGRFLVFRLL